MLVLFARPRKDRACIEREQGEENARERRRSAAERTHLLERFLFSNLKNASVVFFSSKLCE